LPGEVRARREGDRFAQLAIFHLGDRLRDRRIERDRAGNLGRAELNRAVRRLDHADAEAERTDGNSGFAEAGDQRVGQEGQLARPDARRRAHDEDPLLDRNRHRPLGDPCPHRRRPHVRRKGSAVRRKPVLARAREHLVEPFGGEESFASPARHRTERP